MNTDYVPKFHNPTSLCNRDAVLESKAWNIACGTSTDQACYCIATSSFRRIKTRQCNAEPLHYKQSSFSQMRGKWRETKWGRSNDDDVSGTRNFHNWKHKNSIRLTRKPPYILCPAPVTSTQRRKKLFSSPRSEYGDLGHSGTNPS